MKYVYDRSTDSLAITFAEGRRYRDSEEISDGVVIDYDTSGRPFAIEFPDRASRFVDTARLASGREIHVAHPDVPPRRSHPLSGSEIRARRDQLGMTQSQLGQRIGVPANTIARWERGELRIDHPEMLRLALSAITAPSTLLETALASAELASRKRTRSAKNPSQVNPRHVAVSSQSLRAGIATKITRRSASSGSYRVSKKK